MSRKVCRRKHYALVNPIDMAIKGCRPTDQDVLDQIRLRNLSAIDAFAHGRATQDDWREIADMANVSETMALAGVGPEVLQACEAVAEALADAYRRYKATGRLGMTGPQLVALRELHAYYDLQLSSIQRSDLARFIRLTANRIQSAHPSLKTFI